MEDKQIKKVCGFYVNDWHFTMTILPYIRNKIEEKDKIITLLQNNAIQNIKEILSKMNLNKTLENKILEIEWTKSNPIKYTKMKQKMLDMVRDKQNINIIINGDKEYIKSANKNIEEIIKNCNLSNTFTLINCYNIAEFTNVSEITNNHDYILNTAGIKKIEEIFKKEA